MITGKENILNWFEKSGQNSWIIYLFGKSDSSQIVASSTPEIDSKRAYDELSSQLDWHRGRFSIAACNDGKRSPRSDWRTDIEISGTPQANMFPIHQQPQTINGFTESDVNAKVEQALHKYKTEQELEALRKENTELKKQLKEAEKQDPWDRIGEIAMQFIPGFLGQQQAQVAGFPQPTNFQHNPQANEAAADVDTIEQQRFEKVVETFQRVAPGEWLDLLEKLAAKVEQNPGIIAQFKMFL